MMVCFWWRDAVLAPLPQVSVHMVLTPLLWITNICDASLSQIHTFREFVHFLEKDLLRIVHLYAFLMIKFVVIFMSILQALGICKMVVIYRNCEPIPPT